MIKLVNPVMCLGAPIHPADAPDGWFIRVGVLTDRIDL